MNKKTLKIVVVITILLVISFLGYQVATKAKEKNAIANSIINVPEFSFKTLDSIVFTSSSLYPNLPIVFLYFNSECEYCQYEAQSISENIDEFKDIQLVFVSTESIEKIIAFSKQYNLIDKENIIFLNDTKDEFSKIFNASSIPFTLIYDKKQQLIKTHKGQLNAVGILRIINEQK
ncbi:peroxiredoxin [uncultured Winogradskyella sp.]|uniref:peroxiredoxin family protein n=1 Tax=uncultured Winogradskyella sp. TaxID=395353 RepID=UPI002612BA98|nr:TlpA disulfide reductase family protein [uncultured Winogradskyella sp.]